MKRNQKLLIVLFLLLATAACRHNYTPKPRGFFRIEFPEKSYHPLPAGYPYQFDVPGYATVVPDTDALTEPYWINVSVPQYKAEIHLSYKKIEGNLGIFTEESRELAYKHTIKADGIEEQLFINPKEKVFGTIYKIKGNAASPMQFYLTDSVRHFLRGSFYIREVPNIDSLKPIIDFLEPDLVRMIESTKWVR